jgi:hypothetical protein
MEYKRYNTLTHKPCIERIEEMYQENKQYHKLCQDLLQKYLYTETMNLKKILRF